MMGVKNILLQNGDTLELDGVFVAIGSSPYTKLVDHMNPERDGE